MRLYIRRRMLAAVCVIAEMYLSGSLACAKGLRDPDDNWFGDRSAMPEPGLGPAQPDPGLASFAWRYNRRFQLTSLIPRLVHSAVRTAPLPYPKLIAS